VREVLRGVTPFLQPHPCRNPGGDCFVCALTAAARHLFPERPITFDEAYSVFERNGTGGESWIGMKKALWGLRGLGYPVDVRSDLVIPEWNPDVFDHGWWQNYPSLRWVERLEAWLAAGWVAVSVIDFDGRGPVLPDGKLVVGNHFVLLDGVRGAWQPIEDSDGKVYRHEVHVVCSVRGAYWVSLEPLLQRHGAAAWLLVRRNER
jgi:hypothetical protein